MHIQFPLAIDFKHPASVGHVSLPLPPVPDGWTRLLAEDYSAGDEWIDHPAVYADQSALAGAGDLTAEPVLLVPAWREQVLSGVCREYQRRAEEWAAQQPAPTPAPEPVP